MCPEFTSGQPTEVADALEMYRRLVIIRRFEERVAVLYAAGQVPGFVHLSIGQEAAAVGACWPLTDTDVITSTHRGHGHCLAKGMEPEGMFAELMARDSGTNGGHAGSMHLCDPRRGIFGANGIVGAGLPIAVGAAFASRQRGDRSVVVAFFGEGAVGQGAFHEAANLAGVWQLPVVFFCEANGFSEFSTKDALSATGLDVKADAYGAAFRRVDGNDVLAVARTMSEVVDALRAGHGPFVVEAVTYRWRGHYEGDPGRYRAPEQLNEWMTARDPLERIRDDLRRLGVDQDALATVERQVEAHLEAVQARALADPEPPISSLTFGVTAPRALVSEQPIPDGGPADYRYMDAIRDALAHELESDPRVFVAGIDVGAGGNVFGVTRGLFDAWPDRVLDTPISEAALIGLAVGSAMAGLRPVVEVMYVDFLGACFDQILNQAAKLRYMTGGLASLGLVIRTQFGAGKSSGSQHSQSLEALLAHIPGLTVVMPSSAADAYGLLRTAIRDPNPVIFIEHRHLYGRRGLRPPPDHLVPLGAARIVRPGRHATVVSYSRMLLECLAAADELAESGIDVEVIDLRTVSPLDGATILESVERTHRLLIAHEAVTQFGVGAEISALVADQAFWVLDAPIVRIGAPFTPPPYAPNLEREWLPERDAIAHALRRLTAI